MVTVAHWRQRSTDHPGRLRPAVVAKAGKHLKKTIAAVSPTTFPSPWLEYQPQPDRADRSDQRRGASRLRSHQRAGHPARHRPVDPRRGAGRHLDLHDTVAGVWTPRTDDQAALAIGALAIAPSNPNIVYAGTGEGTLSGDSYFGNGFLKSTDGGITWTKVSGNSFRGVARSPDRGRPDQRQPRHRLWAAVPRPWWASADQPPPTTASSASGSRRRRRALALQRPPDR